MWFLSYFAPKRAPVRRTDVLSIGFKWVANAGVPAVVEVYKKPPGDQEATYPDVAAGIYVGCQYDYFGSPEVFTGPDDETVDPVYDPLQPSQGLLQAAAEVGLSNPRMLSLLQGYFRYTSGCLDQIYANQIGQQVIDGIVGAGKVVLVYPSGTGNSVQVQNMQAALSRAAEALVFADKRPLNAVVLQDLVAGAYPGVDIAAAFDNLATAVNAMPLCSEFALPSHPDGFLGPLMPPRIGQPLNGQVLQQWLAGQCPAMTTFLQYRDRSGYQASGLMLEGVALPNYFYIALIAKLHASSGPGPGSSSKVMFCTARPAVPDDRPPVIGLAHELVHAYHNARGTQPGRDIGHWSTVLTELLCIGVAPFADAPLSENTIRASWQPVLGRREVYEPVPTAELEQARQSSSTV